jgi:predicted TPR repeat methyltransferase
MKFEEDYFVNSTSSNYSNYLDKKFDLLTNDLIAELSLGNTDSVLDFGCATGGLVSSLNRKGIFCVGTDISYWAIDYGRQEYQLSDKILQHYNRQLLEEKSFDVVICLDVLEHVPTEELHYILSKIAAKRLLVRLPVSENDGENFVLKVSQNDKTHIQIHSKVWWENQFEIHGFDIGKPIQRLSLYDSVGVLSRLYIKEIDEK